MGKDLIDIETLCKLLRYDPDTGLIFWRNRHLSFFKSERDMRRWNRRYADQQAMNTDGGNGYMQGAIFKKLYKAHRVAFALHNGRWPSSFIDHINGNRSDNRACNLREASRYDNAKNAKRRDDNTSGVTGVSWCERSGAWRAYINSDGQRHELGKFASIEAAALARAQASKEFGFHENHGRTRQ